MPVIHDYADGSGIYLNSNINGSYITLQATPAAESFLAELGYRDGDSVSWQLIKPLWKQDHIYTGGGGTTVEADDVKKSRIDSSSLSRKEQNQLEKFLTTDAESRDVAVPEDVYGFLKGWSPNSEYSKAETARFLERANDREGIIKSVRHIGPHHPICVEEARMSDSGNPVYSFSTGDCKWTATDLRWSNHPSDWMFTVCPGDGFTQTLHVSSGDIQWSTVGDADLGENDIRNTLMVYPDIVWYCEEVPGYNAETTSWNLTANAPAGLPDEFESVVEEVSTAATTGQHNEVTEGIILSLDEHAGYGRLQTVDYQTIPFNMDEYADPDDKFALRELLAVSFHVQPHRDTKYAFDLEPAEISGRHLSIDGLLSPDEREISPEGTADGSESTTPDDIHEILVEWCDDVDTVHSIENQVKERVTSEQRVWDSIQDFESCDRIAVRSLTITSNGTPQFQIEFHRQGNTDLWEVTHDVTEGPVDLEITIFPSQAPIQEVRMAEGLVEYWRLAPLSEEPESEAEYRNDPVMRRHRYHLTRNHSVRLFKSLVRNLESISFSGGFDQKKYHMGSLPDP